MIYVQDVVCESESFDIDSFIPLLHKHIRKTKPYIRQLIVGTLFLANIIKLYLFVW